MLLGLGLNFIFISFYLDNMDGFIFSLFILTVAAAEAALGLALAVLFFKIRGSIEVDLINTLKG